MYATQGRDHHSAHGAKQKRDWQPDKPCNAGSAPRNQKCQKKCGKIIQKARAGHVIILILKGRHNAGYMSSCGSSLATKYPV
jgi:hypothetical protein